MSFTKSNRLITTALLLVLGSAGTGMAQQMSDSTGMVRITDGRARSGLRPVSERAIQQTGAHWMGAAQAPCPTCPPSSGFQSTAYATGNCPPGSDCPTGNCPGGCPNGCFNGVFGEHYCKHSPDYGYAPPSKYPLHRRGVEYTNYYPLNWYGAGADYSQSPAPMVYQPTDTTQLGYYYQHVPFWQPMPNRLPPRPIPAQWHSRPQPVNASRFSNGGGVVNNGLFGHGAFPYFAPAGVNGTCPPTTTTTMTPTVPTQPIPPQPLGGSVVPAIQPLPQSGPIDPGIESDVSQPSASGRGTQPGQLPPLPTATASRKSNQF